MEILGSIDIYTHKSGFWYHDFLCKDKSKYSVLRSLIQRLANREDYNMESIAFSGLPQTSWIRAMWTVVSSPLIHGVFKSTRLAI